MKKILIVLLAALTIVSCQKKEEPVALNTTDVVFSVDQVDPDNGLKTGTWNGECETDGQGVLIEPVDAYIMIDGVEYFPEVFRIDGKLYTQAIKLATNADGSAKTYEVQIFALRDGSGNFLMATPETGAEYEEYISPTLPFNITVTSFAKTEVPIEVLCFMPEDYTNFGFNWFEITEIVIREFCFFGDICLNGEGIAPVPDDYLYSLYDAAQLPAGTQPDMPAIIKMHVYGPDGEVPNSPFTNATPAANYGVGAPLCVQYPDRLNVQGEEFTFDLEILVKNDGGSFSYQPYYQFFSTDDGVLMLDDNATPVDDPNDGIVDFVVGSCNATDTDLVLDWLTPITTTVVRGDDLAEDWDAVGSDPAKWFFFDDVVNNIDNSIGGFVTGPVTPPAGSGSSEIVLVNPNPDERPNLATSQFVGVPLADITTFAYSTYNPSAGNGGSANRSGYLNFNVDLNGSNTWQSRLVYVPSDNGSVVQDTWQEWDVLDGGTAMWRWSGNLGGGPWVDGVINPATGLVSWDDILTAYPNAKMLALYPFCGVRVGEPYDDGYTENIDAFKFGTGGTYITYDFEN